MTRTADGATPTVVLVTGASSGIGRATAHLYAERGAALVLLARSERTVKEVADECLRAGAESATVVAADVRDGAAVDAAVAAAVAEHGRIDVCVHSAAVVAYGHFLDVPPQVFDEAMSTNVLGTANVARAVLPVMREQGEGSLVLLGSVLGKITTPQLVTYSTGKWAVRGLARMLSQSMRDVPGVSVTTVSPGGVNTPVYLQAANYAGRVARPPAPVDQPEKVARAVLRAADRRAGDVSVGLANPVMVLGHTLLPRVFDALVAPLMGALAFTRETVRPHTGNVLSPTEHGEALRGPWSRAGVLGVSRGRPRANVADDG